MEIKYLESTILNSDINCILKNSKKIISVSEIYRKCKNNNIIKENNI